MDSKASNAKSGRDARVAASVLTKHDVSSIAHMVEIKINLPISNENVRLLGAILPSAAMA